MAYDPTIDYKAMAAGKSEAEIAAYAQANGFSAADIGMALGTTAEDVTNRGYNPNVQGGYTAPTPLGSPTSNGTPTAANAWQTTYDPTRNADYRAMAQGRTDQEIASYAKNLNLTADQLGGIFGGTGQDAIDRGYSPMSLNGYNAPTGILGKANAPGNNGVATQNTIIGNQTVDQYGRGISRSYAPGDSRNVFSANMQSDADVKNYLAQNPNMTPAQYIAGMQQYGVDLNQLARVTGMGQQQLMKIANDAGISNNDLRRGGILTNAAGMYDNYAPSVMNGINPSATNPGGLAGPGQTGTTATPVPGITRPNPVGSPGGGGLVGLPYFPGDAPVSPAQPGGGTPAPGAPGQSAPGSSSSSSSSMTSGVLGDPTPWNVTDPQTVEGRMVNLMNPENATQQFARTQAMEQMNERGLGNSSMAITAGQLAANQAALPIAQADAATFAKSAGYNADQQNQFANTRYSAEQQAAMAKADSDLKLQIANMQADTTKWTATLDAQTRGKLAQMSNDAAKDNNAFSAGVQLYANLQQGIATIMNGTTMDYNSKIMAVRNLIETTKGGFDIISNVASVPGLADYIDFSFADSDQVAIDQGFAPGTPSNSVATQPGILDAAGNVQSGGQ